MANLLRTTLLTLAASSAAASAWAGVVTVKATRDIFLASQPAGASVTGYFGTDTAPSASPVALDVVAGTSLTFSATGSASVDANCFAGPDGGCYADESGFSPPPASGTYMGPATALVGVFLDGGVTDVSMGPASLDFTQAANRSLASQAPILGQIFFIGDGLTGTGSGAVQTFIAPTGAAKLYIAVADSIGASGGNPGSLVVDFTGATLAAAVPEPGAWGLMLIGMGCLGGLARRRRGALAPAAGL